MLKRFASLVGAVAFAFVVFAGCNDSPASPESSSFDKAAVEASTGFTLEEVDLFRDPPTPPGNPGERPPMPPGQRPPGLNLERILRALELTAEQVPEVRECLQAHKECMAAANADAREARQAAMEAFREAAAAIRADLEAGDITPEEAREAMADLAKETRNGMKDLMKDHDKAVADCKKALDDCLKDVLTGEQWAKWVRLTQPKKRP